MLAAAGWDGCAGREGPLVVFLGDSLTDGYGLSPDEAYPALLARELARRGRPIRARNAGRSGDTVAQGAARLAAELRDRPDVVVVALGVNDAVRGTSAEDAERALRRIVAAARAAGARVLLVGTEPPPALATPRARLFSAIYARVASDERLAFVPDLLAGASDAPGLMQPDGLHPTAAGQRRLAETVRPVLELVLADLAASGRSRRP